MAEFCSNCPIKFNCVGDSGINLEHRVEQPFEEENSWIRTRVFFTDVDGMNSQDVNSYFHLTGAVEPLTADEIWELSETLTKRVSECNGASKESCPAISVFVLDKLVKTQIQLTDGQTDTSVVK